MTLDDLQWADSASLQLIQVPLTDRESSKILIIGCYRSNEVDEQHELSTIIRAIKDEEPNNAGLLGVTEIELSNLGIDETNKILMTLLSMDNPHETLPLVCICHKKTLGNPFFLIQFVLMLAQENLITFHLGVFKWNWDTTIIEECTTATDNVVQLIKGRMEELPKPLLRLFQVVACVGSAFSDRVVWMFASSK